MDKKNLPVNPDNEVSGIEKGIKPSDLSNALPDFNWTPPPPSDPLPSTGNSGNQGSDSGNNDGDFNKK